MLDDLTDLSYSSPAGMSPSQQALQDSGYGSHTGKRREEHEQESGDKENSSPNKKVTHTYTSCSKYL